MSAGERSGPGDHQRHGERHHAPRQGTQRPLQRLEEQYRRSARGRCRRPSRASPRPRHPPTQQARRRAQGALRVREGEARQLRRSTATTPRRSACATYPVRRGNAPHEARKRRRCGGAAEELEVVADDEERTDDDEGRADPADSGQAEQPERDGPEQADARRPPKRVRRGCASAAGGRGARRARGRRRRPREKNASTVASSRTVSVWGASDAPMTTYERCQPCTAGAGSSTSRRHPPGGRRRTRAGDRAQPRFRSPHHEATTQAHLLNSTSTMPASCHAATVHASGYRR